ncbi:MULTISPECIES: carbohydrate binding domain-containing protein [Dictyoglomus]|uniref:Carbohydrate-binding CenC domain protein n=1 Tax=Dictyoglomus turgidum (strain DSM 6724 / Z-1310) TaxID=515635 RepID=B8E3A0_DICTD|nr:MULTISPECIES: carbohydrate binding domain-containing protein [Dictyoglomus]ACK42974.1 Carbohydrate-binding CenC domain protein [Dictyoglomus turgidum DSM 6724]HBU31038.1 1,4-beta-xylanase [Dictyoglomus sp.]
MYKKLSYLLLVLFLIFVVSGCAPKETGMPIAVSQEAVKEVTKEVPNIPNAVLITTFESGKEEGWTPNGEGVSIAVVDKDTHTGKYSLYITGRKVGWNGAQIQLKDLLKPGKTYSISLWVKHNSELPQHIGITMRRRYDSDSSTQYDWISHNQETPGGKWIELSGTYQIPAGVNILDLALYVEVPSNSTLDLYIDDLVIVEGKQSFRITPELFNLFASYFKDYLN